MAVNLEKFNVPGGTSGTLVQPKLGYRFRVVMNGMGDADAVELTSQVVSATRPSLTHDDVVVDVYNSRIFLAGKHTWDPVTITVKDDVTGLVATTIAKQLERQLDHGTQSSATSGLGYKFGMRIENLDGSDSPEILDAWHLAGCYIQNVNYGENNYSSSDPLNITISVKYDNANHIVLSQGQLEGSAPKNEKGVSSGGAPGG